MGIDKIYERVLRKLLDALKEYFGDNLISVILYGSIARGDAKKDSDIDLLIICKNLPKEKMKREDIFIEIEEGMGMEEELENMYEEGYSPYFSPILKTKEEAETLSPLYLDMIYDARILYDKDGFFSAILNDLKSKLGHLKAKRVKVGKKWYWDLKPDYKFGEEIRIE